MEVWANQFVANFPLLEQSIQRNLKEARLDRLWCYARQKHELGYCEGISSWFSRNGKTRW